MNEYGLQNPNSFRSRKPFSQGAEWFTEDDRAENSEVDAITLSIEPAKPYFDKKLVLALYQSARAAVRHRRVAALHAAQQNVTAFDTTDLTAEFSDLVAKWREETKLSSSTTEIVMHPAYQRIIGLGPKVIPLVLRDLQVNSGHWFWALISLTGENPVKAEDAGRVKKMTQAWLEWGKAKGLIS